MMKDFAHFIYSLDTPPPRSIGIIDLERKIDLIYGAQQLTGKILSAKEIRLVLLPIARKVCTTSGRAMLIQIRKERKVRCHIGLWKRFGTDMSELAQLTSGG
jgi:hypothetical protein